MSDFASFGASFLTPASSGAGKSAGGTGGGLFGAVPSGKGSVSLCFLDLGSVETSFLTYGSNESKDRYHVTFKEKIDEMDGSHWIKVESRRKLKERKRSSPHTLSRI